MATNAIATVGTPETYGDRVLWTGVDGTDDNDIVIETIDVSRYDTFQLSSEAGAMDVEVSFDGARFLAAPLSMADQGATTTSPVIVTAADRVYGFRGIFRKIRVRQAGVTAATTVKLLCARRFGS